MDEFRSPVLSPVIVSDLLRSIDVPWIEVVGDVAMLAAVLCAARQLMWTWPISLVSTACLATFFVQLELFANAWLQAIFFVLAIWGWRSWGWRRGHPSAVRRVRRAGAREGVATACVFCMVWAAAAWFFTDVAQSVQPLWDSCTFALGVLATIGQAMKVLESWLLWIATDLISIPLVWSQGGHLTALLFVTLAGLSLRGMRTWALEVPTNRCRRTRSVISAHPPPA